MRARFTALTDQAQFLAQTTVVELQRSPTAAAVRDVLDRRQSGIESRYPFVSLTVVPVSGLSCPAPATRTARTRGRCP
ncbi:MAG: hypothetical protein R2712_11195 [Vicinamibacterales bacterium]